MNIEQFNILNNHIGYGNRKAEVVFMGLEEGVSENNILENYNYRYTDNNNLKDLHRFHVQSPLHDMNRWFVDGILQSTWGQYCKIMLIKEGFTFEESNNKINKLNYQLNQLGRINGNTLLLELLPLPRPSNNYWNTFLDINGLYQGKNEYLEIEELLVRISNIRDLLSEIPNRSVIVHGKSKHEYVRSLFNNISDSLVFVNDHILDGDRICSEYYLSSNHGIRFYFTPFFGQGQMTNTAYINLASII